MKLRTPYRLPLSFCAACAALSACAGGGVLRALSPQPAALPVANSSGAGKATLSIKIAVPKRASGNSRNPAYISAGTQSVAVVVTPPGGTPAAPQLIACSSGACSGAVLAPAGNDSVAVKLYDQPGGAGNMLSAGTSTVNAAADTTTDVNLTFNPIVSTYTFAASGSFTAGTAGTVGVSAVAQDADGYTIVGPGSYVDSAGNPLTITLTGVTEAGGNATMSLGGNMTFTGPSSTAATLTYNGNSSYGATFSGSSSPARGMIAGTPLAVSGYKITEWPTPTMASNPWDIVLGPDGNLWFTEDNGAVADNVAKITTSGVISEYVLTPSCFPSGLTVGSDNRLWFGEEGTAKIGRINTDGTGYVEFPAAAGAIPVAIVTGPDGNLWFTDAHNDSIGVMSTSGAMLHNYTAGISANALNSTWTAAHGIIVGPDKNLWFVENNINKVARITTSGTVTEFAQPAHAAALAIGPDGNIWDASESQSVTVFNTAGSILHTYGYPGDAILSNADLNDLVTGKDGNLWLVDWNNSVIYGMSASNAVTLDSNGISANQQFSAITVGPDGNLWSTETNTNKVTRLVY